jgi:dihydrolipoamide dehydrogenase
MEFYVSPEIKSVRESWVMVTVQAENAKGEVISLGKCALVSVGRRPYTDGLNADKAG